MFVVDCTKYWQNLTRHGKPHCQVVARVSCELSSSCSTEQSETRSTGSCERAMSSLCSIRLSCDQSSTQFMVVSIQTLSPDWQRQRNLQYRLLSIYLRPSGHQTLQHPRDLRVHQPRPRSPVIIAVNLQWVCSSTQDVTYYLSIHTRPIKSLCIYIYRYYVSAMCVSVERG